MRPPQQDVPGKQQSRGDAGAKIKIKHALSLYGNLHSPPITPSTHNRELPRIRRGMTHLSILRQQQIKVFPHPFSRFTPKATREKGAHTFCTAPPPVHFCIKGVCPPSGRPHTYFNDFLSTSSKKVSLSFPLSNFYGPYKFILPVHFPIEGMCPPTTPVHFVLDYVIPVAIARRVD